LKVEQILKVDLKETAKQEKFDCNKVVCFIVKLMIFVINSQPDD